MSRGKLVAIALGCAVAGVGLVKLGRSRVASELVPLGAADAQAVAASMSTLDAAKAGARALVGRSAYGTQATVTVTT
jgi:hypothetical protein